MPPSIIFRAVHPISNEDTNALPVKEIGPAVEFFENGVGIHSRFA